VDFSYLLKEQTTNTVHLFFNLQPSSFQQWNLQTIQNMLTPITIVNQTTGALSTIPFNNISFSFNNNSLTNQIEITIDYGQ
jgi:hypothetical protein